MVNRVIIFVLVELILLLAIWLACVFTWRSVYRRYRQLWATNRCATIAASALLVPLVMRALAHSS